MPTKSIYQRQCPQIAAVFERAASPKNVLIVTLDFAKDKHLCLLCNGAGDQLLKPFAVHNNTEGHQYLLERIATTRQRHAIEPGHVVIGGEDCPPYAQNLLWALHEHKDKPAVVRVNAWKAKQQRENVQASTDKLDLLGVAKALINREAYPVFEEDERLDTEQISYDAMRELGRTRDAIVKTQTAISNRIHSVVKVLFPGFLDAGKENPVAAFSKASLTLMEKSDFHAGAYARKKPQSLAKQLKKLRLTEVESKGQKLIARARQALTPRPESIAARQKCLCALVSAYRQTQSLSGELEILQAKELAHTPAAVLTSVTGVGILSASAIGGEQGHAERLGPLNHLSSYAGIVPGLEQTGGPDQPARTRNVKPRCNRRLKNHLVRTVNTMGTNIGSPEFRADYRRLKDTGQHADFVMGRRFLRTAKTLMRYRIVYLPPNLRRARSGPQSPPGITPRRAALCEYLQELWPKLTEKWRTAKAFEEAFAKDSPLGIWREIIQATYGLLLPLEPAAPVRLLEDSELDEHKEKFPEFLRSPSQEIN